MKKLFNALMFVFVMGALLMWGGCSNELTLSPPEIQYEGITLTSSDKGVNYSGTIPQDGAEFLITCSKPVSKIVMERGTNDVVVYDPSISGGIWGEIIWESNNCYRFKINANTSDSDRNFVFTFGTGIESCKISLRQSH